MQSNIWQPLSMSFSPELANALQQQHHAAQFIALAGRYLIPPQADDSHTNMQYLPEDELLIGNPLSDGMRLALRLADLKLLLLDKDSSEKFQIPMVAKTKQQVFEKLKLMLAESGLDISRLKNELHYKVPDHDLDRLALFAIKEKQSFQENIRYRHNAEVVLKKITGHFADAAPVRVWPHHFDTATFIPLSHDGNNQVTQSIGLGWAIPDSISNEPYYYLNIWPTENPGDFEQLPALAVGEWFSSEWQGGVLKLSDILGNTSANAQFEHVQLFFNSGIDILTNQFGN